MARENLKKGDTAGPIIPTLDVLRHAKSESIDSDLNVKKEDGLNPIEALYKMQFEPPFIGCIQDVAYNPFFFFYGTPEQFSVFQQYSTTVKKSKISIDATGSLVQKLKRPRELKSAHIFLYCIIINFDNTILSVYQMLTEAQDADVIHFWLRKWLRRVTQKPTEVVLDYSRALLLACAKAFNELSLKNYINICFDCIIKNGCMVTNIVQTYIRIDISHFIHLICRWNCFKHLRHSVVKDFFIRCIALMVDCQILKDFIEIFKLTCIVALQSYEDALIQSPCADSAKDARKKLENSKFITPKCRY